MNELSEIIITIDTREKSQKRISAVESWGLKHGAVVEHQALDLCDYHIEGSFHNASFNTDVDINLGIEAKSLSDFSTSYDELPHKLASAFKQYQDVALFVEMGNYTFTMETDDYHAVIVNPAVRNGEANTLPLGVMEGILEAIQTDGVHVRQLRSESHFPYAIANLLQYISKPYHSGLHIDNVQDFQDSYLNVLAKIPGIGYKSGLKLIKRYPNLSWLTSANMEAYQEVLGKLKGKILDSFVHNHSLETDKWRSGYFKDGSEIQLCPDCHHKQCQCHPSHAAGQSLKSPALLNISPAADINPSHTVTSIQEIPIPTPKVIDDRRGSLFVTPPYTPTSPAVFSSHPNTKDDQQGTILKTTSFPPPMSNPAATTHEVEVHTECVPHVEIVELDGKPVTKTTYSKPKQGSDQSSINTNTRCTPGPESTTHKMSLKHHLVKWFENPHTLQETVDAYGMKQLAGVGAWSGDRIFNLVVNSEKQGLLRSFPQNNKKMYVLAVKPDLDMDIGV